MLTIYFIRNSFKVCGIHMRQRIYYTSCKNYFRTWRKIIWHFVYQLNHLNKKWALKAARALHLSTPLINVPLFVYIGLIYCGKLGFQIPHSNYWKPGKSDEQFIFIKLRLINMACLLNSHVNVVRKQNSALTMQ